MSREHVPRQSGSGSDAAPSSTNAPSSASTVVQTSELMTTAAVTPGTSNATTESTTPSPTSTDPTTSTPQSTSAPQSSSNAPSSSSDTPTPSVSESSSQVTSSAISSSSSAPPSSAIPTPTSSSSSQRETLTTITSAYTTYLSGSQILTTTTIPSTIPEPSGSSSSNRSAIIAGSAAGGTALLILILSLAFFARRKRFKKLHFLDAIMLKRKRDRSRATLLDGEDVPADFDQSPRRYTDYETPWDGMGGNEPALMTGVGTPGMAVPGHAPRWSETGSAFRENVWPPPGEATRLMDPLANRDDLDLGRIVDDVMGPSVAAAHFSDQSISSVYRGSMAESGSDRVIHSRTVSDASNAALLEAAGLGGTLGPGLPSTAPVRSSPLAQPEPEPGSIENQSGTAL